MLKNSVVITTYFGSKFIIEQLDSIKNQTIEPFEVKIFDDGSEDDTIDKVKKYILDNQLSNSWELIINTANKGYARNFFEGALMASGDLIYFCDQDDIWSLDKLERMSEVMRKETSINLLCSNLEPFYSEKNTRKWSTKDLALMKNDGSIEKISFNSSNYHLKRSGCTMCLRQSFLENIKDYWTANWAHDDFFWKMSVLSSTCSILHYTTLRRRMHENNATVIRKRTRNSRMNQVMNNQKQDFSLLKFSETINAPSECEYIIKKNLKSNQLRIKILKERKLWYWPILYFKYKECYPRVKGIYLDLYLAIIGQYNGV